MYPAHGLPSVTTEAPHAPSFGGSRKVNVGTSILFLYMVRNRLLLKGLHPGPPVKS
ncbi:uncharacterized protein LACBIDRAFT_307379 [Laccaria bicolor S238N-H82]|uniref:Predicted protein n=1 Tax=Laccaria bicolor (strain S238N-H82 / ATCC MYA-4686) TaxID=486041 RepID=B0DQ02_LACBS|nr:uncharacterized protein LACBIDRAFT_307379 [Laccaria bicolor S238N-H82]EDR03205.1 predicted protein [Laccaria bicolor S238N-H82]|eukprot:XP_001886001.1 predicted protein [Laccaria bicolor S238N-H82]